MHTHTQSQLFSTDTPSSMPCYSSYFHPKSQQYYFRFRIFRGKKNEKKNKKNNFSKNLYICKTGFNPSYGLKKTILYTSPKSKLFNYTETALSYITVTYLTYGKEKAKS